ncbi:protein DCL, chloroplastic [Quillaja saponaria]|uniref:Protein DCL, chloroplastic n=1 Tax=Quillaja saponaria TaxID=32244 RepID=A0AAD7LET4_QUISA|nr:protein DCL, chloroplastic [Quillaja saponaria]
MAEETAPEVVNPPTEDMELENTEPAQQNPGGIANDDSNQKRTREEATESKEDEDGVSKKQKVEKSVEEEKGSGPVSLGPKTFGSAVEMFDYFYKFLHYWPPNLNVNKYEHTVLLELIKKGHSEPDNKIGGGVHAFQVRYHPMWKSRCFFLIRDDESVDDFSFRKCVDNILPLPEGMKLKPDVNKALGGKGRGGKGGAGGRGGWRGRGRGGKSRH